MADFRPVKKATTADREKKIWELRSKGWSQQRIADEVGIRQESVCEALKRIYNKHHETFMADIDAYKRAQATEIEAAARNALEQYFESQKDQLITEQSGFVEKGKFVGKYTTSIKKIKREGDKGLLSMYYKGMEEVRKIWGIEAPKGGVSKTGAIDAVNMTVDEKVALFVSIPIEDRLKLLAGMLTIKPSDQAINGNSE